MCKHSIPSIMSSSTPPLSPTSSVSSVSSMSTVSTVSTDVPPVSASSLTPQERYEIYQDFWCLHRETRARTAQQNGNKKHLVEFVDHVFEPQGGLMRWMHDR